MKRVLCCLMFISMVLTAILQAQVVWQKYNGNPVLQVGAYGTWDAGYLESPCVLNNGSTYEMWYAGNTGGVWKIGHATSPDGLVWTKYAGNPVLSLGTTGAWDAVDVGGPCIIYDGTTYKMWYNGTNASDVTSIGYATSVDGINWTKYANNPIIVSSQVWEGNLIIGGPSVIFDGTTYKMWYHANLETTAIGYATSTDGIAWTKYVENPVLEGTKDEWDIGVASPEVIFVDNLYHAWFTGSEYYAPFDKIHKKGYATSTDGINWTKYANPVLEPGPETYDFYGIWGSTTIFEDSTFKMWYAGTPGSHSSINYATSDTGDVVALFNDLIHPKFYSLHQNYPNPFNPVTTISYDLHRDSDVILTIYDISGRLVERLVDQKQNAGNYTVQWDASARSSGVYFYKISTGEFQKVRKCLLVK